MGIFGHLWGFVGDLGVLGVLVTYKLTRGTKFEGVKGGLREFWVVWKGLVGSHLAPLEVCQGTRFGSKNHEMVQLANVYNIGITECFMAVFFKSVLDSVSDEATELSLSCQRNS